MALDRIQNLIHQIFFSISGMNFLMIHLSLESLPISITFLNKEEGFQILCLTKMPIKAIGLEIGLDCPGYYTMSNFFIHLTLTQTLV